MTCRDLLSLELFKNIPLVAGVAGLDHEISWPYAKHTKVITPWVQGGEFVLVSGYESGVNEEELLFLLEEAVKNKLSGLLIEGGINFKTLSPSVIERANRLEIPVFFVPRVVSFLDICREISSIILENQIAERNTSSFLERLLSDDSLTPQYIQLLCESYEVPYHSQYKFFYLAAHPRTLQPEIHKNVETQQAPIMKELQSACNQVMQRLGQKIISWPALNSITYLIFGEKSLYFEETLRLFQQVVDRIAGKYKGYTVTLSLSSLISSISEITKGFNQALYTNSLLSRGLFSQTTLSFDQLGSYQFLFYIEDKEFLRRFRDQYLKELHAFDQEKEANLIETLRIYLEQGGNMLRSADILFIHRNTLQYRLNRIETITGRKLDDIQTRQNFLNALMIERVFPFR